MCSFYLIYYFCLTAANETNKLYDETAFLTSEYLYAQVVLSS